MSMERIYLSPPNVDNAEAEAVQEVLSSGWIAPIGPALDEFEKQLSSYYGKNVLALNSGTSALHLALKLAGVEANDIVITSSFTFAACANVIRYEKAVPVFLDSEETTWNLDPELLAEYLSQAKLIPRAVIVTHLYGMPAKLNELKAITDQYNIALIEDAAEALGSIYHNDKPGSIGHFGVVSFNGNKIVTTSGGGALITNSKGYEKGLHLATQANNGIMEYNSTDVGYNYRMSNVLAGLGTAQLNKLSSFVEKKRMIFSQYKEELSAYFDFLDEPVTCKSNRWLTTGLLKSDHSIIDLISYLEGQNIETRRLWKPLHLHSAYAQYEFVGSGICERLFDRGICFPSGTGLSDSDQTRVIESIKQFLNS